MVGFEPTFTDLKSVALAMLSHINLPRFVHRHIRIKGQSEDRAVLPLNYGATMEAPTGLEPASSRCCPCAVDPAYVERFSLERDSDVGCSVAPLPIGLSRHECREEDSNLH